MVKNNKAIVVTNITFIVLFVISAGLQYNDPDPYLWVPIYLYPAVLCFYALNRRYYPMAYFVGIVLYLAYALLIFFDSNGVLSWLVEHNHENIAQSMKASKPYIESAREFFGLLILILSMLINWMYYQSHRGRLTNAD